MAMASSPIRVAALTSESKPINPSLEKTVWQCSSRLMRLRVTGLAVLTFLRQKHSNRNDPTRIPKSERIGQLSLFHLHIAATGAQDDGLAAPINRPFKVGALRFAFNLHGQIAADAAAGGGRIEVERGFLGHAQR